MIFGDCRVRGLLRKGDRGEAILVNSRRSGTRCRDGLCEQYGIQGKHAVRLGFQGDSADDADPDGLLQEPAAAQAHEERHKGKTVWVYPDPTVCRCLYIGDQNAYDAYVKKAAQKTTTDMNELNGPDNPTNMDFSPWVE